MKKLILFFVIILGIFSFSGEIWAVPSIDARSAILLDGDSGKIIFEKNAEELRQPASTTKILTAIIAIENGQLNKVVEVSKNAASIGEASLGLYCGDKITLLNLIHGALLRSGNDACVAIAEAVAPSEEEFIGLMNLKAKTIGAENTTFYNTNGLPDNNHLTTAYDLAVIARYALKNQVFQDIVKKKDYVINWANSSRKRYIKNTNKLLLDYPLATGVKTGTTDKAGKCLVASAVYQGRELIAVVLKSPNRFGEARRLLEYGFSQ